MDVQCKTDVKAKVFHSVFTFLIHNEFNHELILFYFVMIGLYFEHCWKLNNAICKIDFYTSSRYKILSV